MYNKRELNIFIRRVNNVGFFLEDKFLMWFFGLWFCGLGNW